MIQAETDDVYLRPTEKTVLKGYKQCRDYVRENFDEFKWAFSNLSGQQKYAVWAILTFSGRCWRLLGLDQGSEDAAVIQKEWRDENRDWFNGKYRSPRLVALVDAFQRFDIDQQYLIDMLGAVEQWLVHRQFKTNHDYQDFARNIGGPVMQSIVHVVDCEQGVQPKDLQAGANKIGQSIAISQMLSNLPGNLKRGRVFLPQDQLTQYHCRVSDLCIGRGGDGFHQLIDDMVDHTQQDLMEGAEILPELSFDGQRVMKSILSLTLRLLNKIKSEPDAILERPVELSAAEQLRFHMKHILGIEGGKEFAKLAPAHH